MRSGLIELYDFHISGIVDGVVWGDPEFTKCCYLGWDLFCSISGR